MNRSEERLDPDPSDVDLDDESLMARYVDGDPDAFAALYDRFESRIYGYFLKRTGSPERARDLFQELFLKIHRHRDRYDRQRAFAPWLYRIARHVLIDDGRRTGRASELAFDEESLQVEAPQLASISDHEECENLLSTLSDDERYILIASKVDGIQFDQLAREVGKSTVAVRKAASRAVAKARDLLVRAGVSDSAPVRPIARSST